MKKIYYYLIGILLLIIAFLFDKEIVIFFTSFRTELLDKIAINIHNIQAYTLFIITLGILLVARKENKILPLIFAFLFYLGITSLIKNIVLRPRPFAALGLEQIVTSNPDKSFPSGHATAVSTIIPFLDFNKILRYGWVIIAIIVALSRVYLGVHYLSDVIAGLLLGYLIGEISILLISYYKKNLIKKHHRKV